MNISIFIFIISLLLLVAILSIFVLNKYKILHIDIAKYLVSFIKLKMNELDLKSENFEVILDLMTQAILYSLSTRHPLQTLPLSYDKSTNKAVSFIMSILSEINIVLTDTEISIIKNIIKSTLLLLDNLQVSKKITEYNYMNIYKTTTKYMKIEDPQILGLRKHFK